MQIFLQKNGIFKEKRYDVMTKGPCGSGNKNIAKMSKEKTTGMRFRANRRKGSRNTGGNRTLTDSVHTRIETERVCRTRGRTNGAVEGIRDAAPGED